MFGLFGNRNKRATKQSPSGLVPAGIFARLRLFLFCEVLRLAIGGDAAHQLQRQGLIQRELHRALAEFKRAKLRGECGDSVRAGVKADVTLIAREMDKVAVEVKRGDSVGDLLRGFGGDFENRVAHLVEFFLHLRWELEDVVGDGGGHSFFLPYKCINSIAYGQGGVCDGVTEGDKETV